MPKDVGYTTLEYSSSTTLDNNEIIQMVAISKRWKPPERQNSYVQFINPAVFALLNRRKGKVS